MSLEFFYGDLPKEYYLESYQEIGSKIKADELKEPEITITPRGEKLKSHLIIFANISVAVEGLASGLLGESWNCYGDLQQAALHVGYAVNKHTYDERHITPEFRIEGEVYDQGDQFDDLRFCRVWDKRKEVGVISVIYRGIKKADEAIKNPEVFEKFRVFVEKQYEKADKEAQAAAAENTVIEETEGTKEKKEAADRDNTIEVPAAACAAFPATEEDDFVFISVDAAGLTVELQGMTSEMPDGS